MPDLEQSIRNKLSAFKWLMLASSEILRSVRNWPQLFAFFGIYSRSRDFVIAFRNGLCLFVPRGYPFEPIAETMFLNVYRLGGEKKSTVIDVGAGIGDFTLMAAKAGASLVIAYEPDGESFRALVENVRRNGLRTVTPVNEAFRSHTLTRLKGLGEVENIDLIKLDCEGCEYEIFLSEGDPVFSRIRRISMEVHDIPGIGNHLQICDALKHLGFHVSEATIGGGRYVYASRE